jgi:hypothetical protein
MSLLRQVYCKVGGQSIIRTAMGEQRGGGEEDIGLPRVETLRGKPREIQNVPVVFLTESGEPA